MFLSSIIANMPMQNAVKEIMSTNLETIDVTENAQQASKKMNDKRISSVLVIDRDKKSEEPMGIITERDLVKHVCASGISSKEVGFGELSPSLMETVEAEETFETEAVLR